MYSLKDYGRMIADRVRLSAYVRALRRVVKPGCVVADIGTGTGIMALHACRLGARRVYAVDTSDAIAIAMAMARVNGFSDRIVCVQADCRQFTPPEPVDVAVADLRGILPLFPGNLETLAHVRSRWLRPGGKLIPARDVLRVAPVRSARLHRQLTAPWQRSAGLDLSPALRWASNQVTKTHLSPRELLAGPKTWDTVEYGEAREHRARALHWDVRTPGPAHGFAVWFDSELSKGIGFSNAPGKPPLIYGQAFFSFERPLSLARGDRLELEISAQPAEEYVWSWSARVMRGALVRHELRQSTFMGQLVGPATLRKRAGPYRAPLNATGRVTHAALDVLASGSSVEETARMLLERHGAFFDENAERALTFAADVSERYF